MATSVIKLDIDGFGFLDESDDCCNDDSKMSSTTLKEQQQPPISPIESESSSGISSLDSDDLKKQLLSSPPTISISHDEEEEEEEVDRISNSGSAEKEQTDSGADGDDEELDSSESGEGDDENGSKDDKPDEEKHESCENKESIESNDIDEVITSGSSSPIEINSDKSSFVDVLSPSPMKVIYEDRDILNLGSNIGDSGNFIKYTILPENNISCFFQNRAQYWRLCNEDEKELPDAMTKCSCCDFTFPSINNNQLSQQGQTLGKNKNPITDSLLTFLKNHHADYNNFNTMPNSVNANNISSSQNNNINANNNGNMKRMYNNNNNAPYIAYQMMQQQQQQYANNSANNGFYANGMNGWNAPIPPPPPQTQQQINPFGNATCGGNNNGYNGTALAILNLMNPPRNPAGAFQTMNNNASRYYNNMNTTNTGFGLYKQF